MDRFTEDDPKAIKVIYIPKRKKKEDRGQHTL